MTYIGAGLAAVAALACVSGAQAQGIDGSVRARVTYDDAAARSSDAFAEARGLEQSDVIGDILATFNVTRSLGRQEVYVRGSAGYDFHRENTQLDSERLNVGVGVSRDIGPCGASLSGNYSRAQSDLEDIEFEPVENIVETESVKVAVNCRRLIGIAPTLSLSQSWTQNSSEIKEDSDAESRSARLGLSYFRPALGSLSVYGEYRETEYSDRLVLVNGQFDNDGFESYSTGVEYNRRVGARLQGSLFLAYNSLNPVASGVSGYDGLTYGGSLSYRPSSRLTTSFSFSRDTQPSNRLDSTYSLGESYTLGTSYTLSPRMSLNVSASHRSQEIKGANVVPGVDITDEETDAITGSVNMKLNRRISLSLDATHQERSADVAGFNYESQRVGLTATAGF